jgi:hypothetical protein
MSKRVKRWRISDILRAVVAQPGVHDEAVRDAYGITRGEAADCVARDLCTRSSEARSAEDVIREWHAFIPYALGIPRLENGFDRASDEEVERAARVLVAEARRLKVPRRA